MTPRRRWLLTLVTIVALGASFAASSIPAGTQTVDADDAATLTVEQVTLGAAGGPFHFELSDGAVPPLVQRGVATTTAEDTAIDVADLGGNLAPAVYTLRQDLTQLPAEPSGGHWEFTSVECDGATVEVDASNATATITLEPGAEATCVVTDAWVADEAATTPETTAPTVADDATEGDPAPADDGAVSEQVEPPPDDVVVPLAIAPLDCSGGTIYQIQRSSQGGSSGRLNAVAVGPMSGTNEVDAAQVSNPIPAGSANALGITPGGQGAWALAPQQPGGVGNTLTFTLYSFNVTTEAWTQRTASIDTSGRLPSGVTAASIRSGGIVAGAVDPLSGNYYWASLANAPNDSLTIFGWNTTTNTSLGIVANSTGPVVPPNEAGSTNGDIAFDRAGNLYVVSSVVPNRGSAPRPAAAVGVIPGPLPTTPQPAPPPTLIDTTLATYSNPNSNAYNGIAFDNTGSLFLQYSLSNGNTAILKINPSNGAVLAGPSNVDFAADGGGIGVDLAACSNPPTLQLQKNVVNRQADTDQFGLAITGGGIATGNTATTSGTATGVQPQSAGPVLGRTGTTYTFTESAAGTTTLANYTTTYQCVDQGANNAVVASGTPTASGTTKSFNFTVPTPTAGQTGQSILCTFTNSAPRLVVAKSAAPVSTTPVIEGQVVTYTLTFNNSGGGQPASVNYTDNLSKVLDDATLTSPPVASPGSGLTVSPIVGNAFTVTGTVPTGQTATVTFSVTVNRPDTGDHQLDNFLIPTGQTPPATCLPANTACTTHPVPALVVSKSAVPASTTPVAEGQLLTYTLTFANTAGKAPATVSHTDDLSRVLDDATVVTPPALATGTGLTVSPISGANTFTVTGAVPAGQTATVTFSVRVNTPDTGDHQLDNFVVPTGQTPPATCAPATPPTCTTHPVPALVVTKSAVPSTTTPVSEGQVLTYTLTFANTAGRAPATVNHTDDLSRVLDDATVTTPPAVASGTGLTVGPITDGAFTITGTIAAGATATVTFSVTVNTPDTGDHVLDNFVVPTGTTPPAECVPTDPRCTTHPVPALVVTKSVVPSSTTPVNEGQVLNYTVTFANSAGRAPASVNYTDNLSRVLDDATVVTPPAVAPPGSGLTVSSISPPGVFTVTGTLAAGATATVTFSVTVNTPDTGDHQLDNFVVPTGETPPTLCLPTNPRCTTNPVPVARLTLVKSVINQNGGNAQASEWTLTATGPTRTISGATNTGAVTNAQVPPGVYNLSETGPLGYAASPWSCTGAAVSSGTSVTLASGESATCVIVNDDIPARLTLLKTVISDNGGGAADTAWTLTATGPTPGVSGREGDAAITNALVSAGVYNLSESGPPGYAPSDWVCVGGTQAGASIALALGQAATCSITNNDVAPRLTLLKDVVNDAGGTAADTEWTLTATGPTPNVTGVEGDLAITNAPVMAGVYTLTESGPAGYTPSTWVCTGAAVSAAASVTLAVGEVATCTITNSDDPALLTLMKQVSGGTAVVGDFTLTALQAPPNSPGSIDGAPISGVTGNAAVTNRPVRRGVFALTETGPSGYLESWRCVDGTGATISMTNQVEIPSNNATPAQLTVTCTVINTTSALDVNISGPATNPVGRTHTFTITATRVDTGAPLPGALLDVSVSGAGTITANTCATEPGTGANGQCTVTVTSNSPGPLILTVNGFTNQGPNGPVPNQPFVLPAPVTSTKLWTSYRVEGESAVNLASQAQHTFTLTGFQDDGVAESALPNGSVITYTWSGASPASPPSQCIVDANGTCDVIVTTTPGSPGSGTLTVTSIIVNLPNGTGSNTTSYTLAPGDAAFPGPPLALTKTWIEFRVRVESSEVNLAGDPHTFTVTAEYAIVPDTWQPVSGGTVNYTWDSTVGAVDPSATTCGALSASGTCTVTVVQAEPAPGAGTLTITGLTAPIVNIGGVPTTISEPISTDVDLSAASAEKTWFLVDVTITPGADNLAGEPHTFTVQVTGFDGDGPFPDGEGVPGAVVSASFAPSVGSPTLTGNTCATGTDANGQCTIIFANTGSGSVVVQLDQVTATIAGTPFVIALTDGSSGLSPDALLPIQSDKTWWQYRVILSDSAINPLGVSHTFTATVERSSDGGTTWLPVPDGTFLAHDWSDPNSVSQVDPASTCLPTSTGTVGGTCTFIVASTGPTTGTLVIDGIVDTWLDRDRDGVRGADELVDVAAAAFGSGSSLTQRKTWWDFEVEVSGPAENPVGTDHTFNLTVRFSNGSASGFRPVAPGTTLTYSWTGPSGSAEVTGQSTCDPTDGPGTDASGQCTVVIGTPSVPGTGTLTVNGIASTSIPQPTRNISFTFPTPETSQKTWIAYRAVISPNATNLTGTEHAFTIEVQQDRGDGAGFVAVPDGTTLAVTLSDPTKLTTDTCATGTTGGTCTVVVDSADPGSVTVTPGAITVALLDGTGATVPITVQPDTPPYAPPESATKTWVAYLVTVSGPSTNPVGVPHAFTITATRSDGDPVDGASIAYTWTGAGTPTPASPCVTDAFGVCTVTVTSPTAGTGTLTVTGLTDGAFVVDLTVPGAPGQAASQVVPLTTSKTWLAYRVTLDASATNLVGEPHTFTATVEQSADGTTWGPVPDGTTLTATSSGTGTLDPASTCTTGGTTSGTCTYVVTDAGPGTLILNVTEIAGTTINGAPVTSLPVPPVQTSKTWLAYDVTVSPSATNPVGVPHVFTITATRSDGAAVIGATVAYTWQGAGTPTPASSCTTGGTGQCTVSVSSDVPGIGTLTVTGLTHGDFTVDLTSGGSTVGRSTSQLVPLTASKTWLGYRVLLDAPATNLVGVPHTFTATVQQSADGITWTPVVAGTTLTVATAGTGTLDTAASTCLTIGTAPDGTCTFVVTDEDRPGTLLLTVTAIAGTTVDGLPVTDLVVPPVATSKTWLTYLVQVSPSATNAVGAPHVFAITALRSDGDPVDGATIAYTWSGTGTATPASSCTTGALGVCTVSVTSTVPGTGTLTVTSITDGAFVVDLTPGGSTIGRSEDQAVPLTASKTWLGYRVLLDAPATNLVGVSHTFTATVEQSADGTTWSPVPFGTTLTATTTGPGSLDTGASTCVTVGTVGGTCTFVVADAGPGTLTLNVTEIAGTTIDGAAVADLPVPPVETSKTWVAYTVMVSPSATNAVGAAHTFTITATRSDGDPVDGATLAYTWTGAGTATPASSCTTDTAGICTVSVVSPTPGTGTLTVTGVTDGAFVVDLTSGGSTVGRAATQVVPLTASKTWLGYRVSLSAAATNLVGVPHTFTATVEQSADGTTWSPVPDGTTLTASVSGPGSVDLAASTCATGGTSGGTCTYVVTDAGPGTLTLTILTIADTTVDGTPVMSLPVTPVETAKTWVAYLVTVSPSATNPVNAPHVFTITATRSDSDPVDGATIAYTWSGAGTATPASSCTTDASGVCTVTVTSSDPGTGTLTVTSVTDGAFVVDLTPGGSTDGRSDDQTVPLTASKAWLGYRVSLSAAATNLVGVPHTFTATVEQSADGNTWTPVPDGTTLTASVSGPGSVDLRASTCATGGSSGGTCTYVVTDAGPGTLTLTILTIADTTIDGTPVASLPVAPVETSKTWVAYLVTVSPSATNAVNAPHVFTITATRSDSDPVEGATVAYTWTGAGTAAPPSSCTTDASGVCTVTVTSSSPGTGTLTVTSVTDGAFVVDLTPGGSTVGRSEDQAVPLTASKTWLGYRVSLSAAATNLVGVPHTFTATVEQSADGNTWSAVPDGTTLTATTAGPGAIDTAASTCATGGTSGGTCTYVVTDAGPGTLTLNVTEVAGTTIDGAPVTDLPVPPVETAKTWVAYLVTVSPSATNAVNAPHVFTITATRSDADPVDGATVAYTWTGAGTAAPPSSCTTDTSGACTVTVTSPDPGTGTLTVTTVTDGAFVVDLTPGGSTIGRSDDQTVPLTASKTWLGYRVSLDAPATNLVGVPHTFTATVEQSADGTTWSPVPDGTTLTATTSGTGTLDTGTSTCETGGTTGGTCTYVVTDAGPGTLTVNVTEVAGTTIDETPVTDLPVPPVETAKTWVAYLVTVSPSATNYVDQAHEFTINATRFDGDPAEGEPVDGATVAYTWMGAGTPTPPSECTTDPTGVCTVTVTSSTPGMGTLTVTGLTDGAFVVDLTDPDAPGHAASQVVPLTASKTWEPGWTLTVVKESSATDPGPPFSFTTTGPAPVGDQAFPLSIGGERMFEGLLPGTYTITELVDAASLPSPWRFESVECTGLESGATVTYADATATLTLSPPSPGSAITCTFTNEIVNLRVEKSGGGIAAVAGGAPIDYTITVSNAGSIATKEPITVTDTLSAGLSFAGAPTLPAGATCAPPSGATLTCTLTESIPPGGSVDIVVPVRAEIGAPNPSTNTVTIDSPEDPLCPDGVCPPPCDPTSVELTFAGTGPVRIQTADIRTTEPVALIAVVGGDPTDNQACVQTPVTEASSANVAPDRDQPSGNSTLPFTGLGRVLLLFAVATLLSGLVLVALARRRRMRAVSGR